MNFDALSMVKFGDRDDLSVFLFENGLQHRLFQDTFFSQGLTFPTFPLIDADMDNLDDWLMSHQVEHQYMAATLELVNPFNMLDVDWNKEDDFYDWLATHLVAHEQIAAVLGLS